MKVERPLDVMAMAMATVYTVHTAGRRLHAGRGFVPRPSVLLLQSAQRTPRATGYSAVPA